MTIDKAIEILNHILRATPLRYDPDQKDAIKLGIEALNRIQACRKVIDIPYNKPLPGEDS